jgi:HAD superfamily hydrolase (TIGR01509 family)
MSHSAEPAPDAVLLDADDTLFASERLAFRVSARLFRRFADRYALTGDFSPEGLRGRGTGKNFRTTVTALLDHAGIAISPDEVDRWVAQEKEEVTAYLARELRPDPDVLAAVSALRRRYRLAVVSSCALSRLSACLTATGMADLLPPEVRFSAEDSLPEPTSKPDPAVYELALSRLGLEPGRAVAVEDSVNGARAALAAGIPTAGILHFVPEAERAARTRALRKYDVTPVAGSWAELTAHLTAVPATAGVS